MTGTMIFAIIVAATVLASLVGVFFARALRMRDYGWKIALILASVTLAAGVTYFLWPPKLGIDLSGGVILIYEVDQEKTAKSARTGEESELAPGQEQVDLSALVQALGRRINPSGVMEVVIRQYGANQVEIIIPKVTENEIEEIKKTIVASGYLKFQILANEQDHRPIIELAEAAKNSPIPSVRTDTQVRDADGRVVAEWVRIAHEEPQQPGEPPRLKVDVPERVRRELKPGEPEALMIVASDPRFRVEGSHLRSVSAGFDETAQPCVRFWMNTRGAVLFGALTTSNLPDKQSGLYRHLGIVFDDELISAPRIMNTITEEGQIVGRFTQPEVDFLVKVLQAGRLPAVLRDEPISQSTINPLLGMDTIRKGSLAIAGSLVAVLAFMLLYYRFSGLIACLALLVNLILIVAVMRLINAAFTLPGLAGLVLTVGMSVDANVLIYERIREELARGAALRMAIRNGFARATTTIVDSNLTTLITAVVLYAIGTDQIRGFAVTLILGIIISMYTAIFCSRVIFDIAERKRWIARLRMMQMVGATQIDFVGKQTLAVVLSTLVILVGLVAVGVRGKQIFDIDFLGGTSVQLVLKEPLPIGQVRAMSAALAEDVAVTQVNTDEYPGDRVYKIDTSLPRVEELERKIVDTFRDQTGKTLLVTRSMKYTSPVGLAPEASGSGENDSTDTSPDEAGTTGQPGDAAATGQTFQTQSELTFQAPIGALGLREHIEKAAERLEYKVPRLEFSNPKWQGERGAAFTDWLVKFTSDAEQTGAILENLQSQIEGTPYLLSSSTIGGAVAGKTQNQAIWAFLASLVGIVAYLWIRFQRVLYGLAATIAVVHDAVVTVGAVALSLWLTKAFGFLLIDQFKINLTVVAALLTIIGYSLNDTIVIFDRIREIKGKSPDITAQMINVSVNQTLSRTLLTAGTTLIVVVILYVFGGQEIHGFAFALLVGVVAGTYSTVYIAAPILLWLSPWLAKPAARKPHEAAVRPAAARAGDLA
jgi:SecD/SecF fusion protein